MKKIYLLFLLIPFLGLSQITTTPVIPLAEGAVAINFDKAGTPLSGTAVIYAHIGVTVNGARWQNVKGTWGTTNAPVLTLVSGTKYKLDLTPDLYTYFGVPTTSAITEICLVLRSADGSVKNGPDVFIKVGAFQTTLISPIENSSTIINSGGSLSITATNTGGTADYNLMANGTSINTYSGSSFSYLDTNITNNKSYDLQITQEGTTFSKKFSVIVNPGMLTEAMPSGLVDGINYNATDATKATLVIDAPGKDFIYVAGSFNNWNPGANYAMKKDNASSKFWLELKDLVSGTNYTYQYWVVDESPIAGSPVMVKTADPYSTLVLNKEEDPWIPAGNYPNMPAYPVGQQREVTVLQTGQTPYAWSDATVNFEKPSADKLVVYELLVRDFDANRSFQNLIDRMDYFKNLNINAIELMPIMEFDGNESWGYNTSFHMALDKAYGTSDKFKEFVDLCHQNGIAVILDLAINHAFGRNPMERMWMNDPDGDGWGDPASDSPYFNTQPMHSYNVGSDFNHQLPRTKTYTKRVVQHWIEEYKIDGIRWDLTKGFTQNCPYTGNGSTQDGCTNNYQQDRVDVLKEYADFTWSVDDTQYIIFEHLGTDGEEQQWANYRINESPSKGVMMWGKMTNEYNQLSMGYSTNSTIERMGYDAHGFTGKRLMGYAESHDEERLMYKNITFGQTSNSSHNVKDLDVALSRMSAVGAVSLLVPGPKMIWQLGDLGWEKSIWTCTNGTVNSDYDAGVPAGDCKLSTKPQPQWVNNWLGDENRSKIYNDWAKMIELKTTEPIFNVNKTVNSGFDLQSGNTFTPRLFIWDNTMTDAQLKNVIVLTNFDVNAKDVTPDFPYTGTWYNLMDNTTFEVTNTTTPINIEAGGFRVFGNKPMTLSNDQFVKNEQVYIYPNPTANHFTINATSSKVQIFALSGQLVKSFDNIISKEQQFNISELNNGMYFVKIFEDNKEIKTMKLLKQ